MKKTIIGLTGPMGSGKGELVKLLQKKGFLHVTLSSLIREEARTRGLSEERGSLMDLGNSMRKEGGAGVLARMALSKIQESGHDKWVIDGIRNPAEIFELRKGEGVSIVGITVDREILIERILGRAREGDSRDREELQAKLDRDWGKGEPEDGQQVGKCLEQVDLVIDNGGTLNELQEKFLNFYTGLREARGLDVRPSKDEYYLSLAKSVCRRATCTKVEIGAVIIKDDQVVATGYCGAPRGTKSSQEHGFCLRKKLGIPSGQRYEMCRSVHAEQNAIINAARSGVSLLGGDMYIYGKAFGDESAPPIDAFPCFICKKMLINCGLKRVVCSLKDGSFKVFYVDDWMKDWSENDIIDDEFQYGAGVNSEALLKIRS
ncbi:AAA family ATPase [Patescibacteria group bacterium]|nr:AAA family ATPase [Patescibacteria group bacterium]